ncbi:MAG: hypothetical protein RLZZ350_750 [Verrucomicrobiota bacterium]|jgi:hypothetical protein
MPHENLNSTVIGVTSAVTVVGLVALLHALRPPPRSPDQPTPRFTDHNLTQRFVSAIPELTKELNLELATAEQVETFTQTDELIVLWGFLDMGTNVAQVRVPVTYRYHVQLRDAWQLSEPGF